MLWCAVLMLVIGGAADMASSAFRNSMLMTAASDAVRGRLQGVFIVVVAGGPRIADVLHGARRGRDRHGATAAIGGLLVLLLAGGRGVTGSVVPALPSRGPEATAGRPPVVGPGVARVVSGGAAPLAGPLRGGRGSGHESRI